MKIGKPNIGDLVRKHGHLDPDCIGLVLDVTTNDLGKVGVTRTFVRVLTEKGEIKTWFAEKIIIEKRANQQSDRFYE